jgi:hypothetical protein
MVSASAPIAVTLIVTEVLEELHVRYAVGGSVASSLHGIFRASVDVDIVAELQHDHVKPLLERFSNDFYLDEAAIVRAIELRRSFNMIHLATMFKVDIFVAREHAFDRALLDRGAVHLIARDPERRATIASAEDVVLAKLAWYREGGEVSEQQWRDVLGVLQVQAGRLDREHLDRMSRSLGVADLLARAIEEASG